MRNLIENGRSWQHQTRGLISISHVAGRPGVMVPPNVGAIGGHSAVCKVFLPLPPSKKNKIRPESEQSFRYKMWTNSLEDVQVRKQCVKWHLGCAISKIQNVRTSIEKKTWFLNKCYGKKGGGTYRSKETLKSTSTTFCVCTSFGFGLNKPAVKNNT